MARILVIDDDLHIGQYVERELDRLGHEVQVQRSGKNVIEVASLFRPQVAILDVMLPGVSGFEICRLMRCHRELFTTSILMLTCMADDEEREHAIRQGADDFLPKPFRMPELREKIDKLTDLYARSNHRDARTSLLSPQAFNKLATHHVARQVPRSLCCLEINSLPMYRQRYGDDAQARVLQGTCEIIHKALEEHGVLDICLSHLGGGYFGLLLNQGQVDAVCQSVSHAFEALVQEVYTPEDVRRGFLLVQRSGYPTEQHPLMSIHVHVVQTDRYDGSSLSDAFAELNQLIRGVQLPPGAGVFMDRRYKGAASGPAVTGQSSTHSP